MRRVPFAGLQCLFSRSVQEALIQESSTSRLARISLECRRESSWGETQWHPEQFEIVNIKYSIILSKHTKGITVTSLEDSGRSSFTRIFNVVDVWVGSRSNWKGLPVYRLRSLNATDTQIMLVFLCIDSSKYSNLFVISLALTRTLSLPDFEL